MERAGIDLRDFEKRAQRVAGKSTKPLEAVDENQNVHLVMKSWKVMFHKRYHHDPTILKADKEVFVKMYREFGLIKTEGLLGAYLDMPGYNGFYQKNAHGPRFIEKDINVIIAHYAESARKVVSAAQVKIKAQSWCSGCKRDFTYEGPPLGLETAVCPECSQF